MVGVFAGRARVLPCRGAEVAERHAVIGARLGDAQEDRFIHTNPSLGPALWHVAGRWTWCIDPDGGVSRGWKNRCDDKDLVHVCMNEVSASEH